MESDDTCERAKGVVVEGFDRNQKTRLQSKKRGGVGVKSDEEKWKDIFRILFPDSTEVPGPCVYCKETRDLLQSLTFEPDYSLCFDETAKNGSVTQPEKSETKRKLPEDIQPQLEKETHIKIRKIAGGDLSETKQRELVAAIVQEVLLPRILRQPGDEGEPPGCPAVVVAPEDLNGSASTSSDGEKSLGSTSTASPSSISSLAALQPSYQAKSDISVAPGEDAPDNGGMADVLKLVLGTEDNLQPSNNLVDPIDPELLCPYDPTLGGWSTGGENGPMGTSEEWMGGWAVTHQPVVPFTWDGSFCPEEQRDDAALLEGTSDNGHVSGAPMPDLLTTNFAEEGFSWADMGMSSWP
ncbi:hypothetical protein CH35J_008853 [Colletotrichum higginsianum]|uniref:Uncharacterized protein n=2 Tax=Colletotrichum higginsianum TaxID=80884 RepID=A0A4T0VTW7_9PEZI|nr:hypothetical protein CH35J_008853 [Colletotrichum higginsianum]